MGKNCEAPHNIPVIFFHLTSTLFSSNMFLSCLFSTQTPSLCDHSLQLDQEKNCKIIILLNKGYVFYNKNIRPHVLSLVQHALTAQIIMGNGTHTRY
jgi:hypothetical protein